MHDGSGVSHSGVLKKTRAFTAIVVVTNVCGNALLSVGMRQVGSLLGRSPLAYIAALFNPWVAAGVALLIVWLISQMTLLSWADLSFVMPVTSAGYVLSAVAGRVFLHEFVSWQRWAGIWLIVFGVAFVSRTNPAQRHGARPGSQHDKELVCL